MSQYSSFPCIDFKSDQAEKSHCQVCDCNLYSRKEGEVPSWRCFAVIRTRCLTHSESSIKVNGGGFVTRPLTIRSLPSSSLLPSHAHLLSSSNSISSLPYLLARSHGFPRLVSLPHSFCCSVGSHLPSLLHLPDSSQSLKLPFGIPSSRKTWLTSPSRARRSSLSFSVNLRFPLSRAIYQTAALWLSDVSSPTTHSSVSAGSQVLDFPHLPSSRCEQHELLPREFRGNRKRRELLVLHPLGAIPGKDREKGNLMLQDWPWLQDEADAANSRVRRWQ
ncbi:uncharacterized protein LOC132020317 [Mustela nigripes]|uniref:uncharacterized protein LOC132020317 n=1 Tax=Mustela nigripes TaxID=77151 RepID=UPI002815A3AF|nr:uncharacterized protein LOC132020317 [Mustela nigripes]